MADNEGVRRTGEAFLVCTSPDVCWTQVGDKRVLVPYQIYARFTDVVGDVPTVHLAGENAVTMETRITTVYGDEQGIHGGVMSGVNMGWCRAITHSTTIRVNGSYLIYHTSTYWMNCNGPDGLGNTQGEVQFFSEGTAPSGGPLVDLEKMRDEAEKSWWERASPWVHGALDIVGLVPGLGEIADGSNALIYLAEGDHLNAGLSAGAMIPFVGWGATATKLGIKGAKEVAEEGVERVVKEAAEEGVERTTKEVTEEAAEQTTKEASEEAAEQTSRQATDGGKVTRPDVKPPNRRHDPCKTRGKDHTKEENSMVDPDVDVAADLSAIKDGKFTRDGQDFVVNDRTYGHHPETGTVYPKSGPGITNVTRPQHQFLKKLNSTSFEEAMQFASNLPGLDQGKIDQILDIWRKCK